MLITKYWDLHLKFLLAMHSKLFVIILLACLIIAASVEAQEESAMDFDEIIEQIAASVDAELDYTTLFSNLENLYYSPLDLNTATQKDFERIIFLTEFQIYSLVKYRQKFGAYKTIYELQYVDGIDPLTLKYLLPFVEVSDLSQKKKTDIGNMFSYGRHSVIGRYQRLFQEKAGYLPIDDSILAINPDKSRYLGSPDKFYLRYNYQYKDKLYYGITMEKDDGEQFFKGAQKYGFDFYSGHFQINDLGVFKKIIVGDYIVQFGQGLTMWSGMSFGKTSSTTNVIKKARGVNKYSSVNESAFMRGQAVTLGLGNFEFTEFVSYKSIDGSVSAISDSAFDSEEHYISSFLETGYHRTPSEIAKRKTIKEFVSGGNLNWRGEHFRIGATGIYYSFSDSLKPNDQAYRYFDFSGYSNANFGIDYMVTIPKVNFFGETSISPNMGYATINGAVLDFVPEFKMSMIYRYYSPDYQNIYAQPFSEGNKPYNESGLFIGFQVFPRKYWKIEAYFDTWKYPWLRYGVGGPSTGNEYLMQVSHYPNRKLDMYFRLKYETKQKNNTDVEYGIRPLDAYVSAKYRYQINYSPTDILKLKNRIELASYNFNGEQDWGYMIYQDVQIKPEKMPFVFTGRIAIFETDTWNTRIYAYEPDVLYAFSVPAYYSKGTRLALIVKYSVFDNLDFWVKIANTFYNDKDGLGTGLDAIEGKNRTDIKLQFRYKF